MPRLILSAQSRDTHSFSQSVLRWFALNGRDFPWRMTSDPYRIYVAEILLRQTQAERVVKPYLEVIARYPTFEALSKADVDELRRWFKPLGLVKRADLMISAAKLLVNDYGGLLPRRLDLLLCLPGMGNYSARAVACLAFGARVPMIDESSGRLLRRLLGLRPRGPAHCDQKLLEVAKRIIPKKHARDYNLGLLDIAAVHCHSNHPTCPKCPLLKFCSNCRSLTKSAGKS